MHVRLEFDIATDVEEWTDAIGISMERYREIAHFVAQLIGKYDNVFPVIGAIFESDLGDAEKLMAIAMAEYFRGRMHERDSLIAVVVSDGA